MIIKSVIRGGFRSAAEYLKEQGKNELTRLVQISDPKARNLDQAFKNMWEVAYYTKCTKPLHHISINPMKGEWLTDAQVMAIVKRCEEVYGYERGQHQRVIVEHIKDGRQHFHVIWNRVSLMTGKAVHPGRHWIKSKQICREMEKELGLKTWSPNRMKRPANGLKKGRKKRGPYNIAGRRLINNSKSIKSKISNTAHSKGRPQLKILKISRHGWKWIAKAFGINDGPGIANSISVKAAKKLYSSEKAKTITQPSPTRPAGRNTGWPPEAIADWKTWGRMNPKAFFAKWPELSS